MKDKGYTDNQLIKLTSGRKSSYKKKIDTSVSKFILKYGILQGLNLVPSYKIYYEYIKDSALQSADKLSKIQFFRMFNKEFTQKRTMNQRYYLLSDCFDFSEDAMQKALDYDKRYQGVKVEKETIEKK